MTNLIRLRDDAPAAGPVATFDACCDQSNAAAVRIEPGDDARALIPFLDRLTLVEVNFPVFGDGRGYSAARILREAGYTGEIRAVGDVLIDQLNNMRRCGFDGFAPDTALDMDGVTAAMQTWPEVYQAATDGRNPIWNIRHGIGADNGS
ncbi:DUF934 domain-containing protein [Pontixanthobacter sp.]|uniref:DUF934 domain-containing protein n=1 Tax=Pontixanthobacter sp. TaxID=2792078 RepID=UPI003C7A2E38